MLDTVQQLNVTALAENRQMLAMLLGTVAGTLFSGLWYWAFRRTWQRAVQQAKAAVPKEERDAETGTASPSTFFLGPINALITSFVLWFVLYQLGPAAVASPLEASGVGAILWSGFSLTNMIWHAIAGVRTATLVYVEGMQQLAQSMIMAALIHSFMW